MDKQIPKVKFTQIPKVKFTFTTVDKDRAQMIQSPSSKPFPQRKTQMASVRGIKFLTFPLQAIFCQNDIMARILSFESSSKIQN
jgi:hypothetical protein